VQPAVAIAVLVAGACAYLVGHALIAARDSFQRTTAGGAVLGMCVLAALFAPGIVGALAGPSASPTLPRMLHLALATAGLLGGMRVWRMRLHAGRAGLFTLDESPISRAEALVPLADSLEGALDVLGRERCTARDLPRLAPLLKRAAMRYSHQLPERQSEVYALVARHVPAELAADVTGLLLEGAGRKR